MAGNREVCMSFLVGRMSSPSHSGWRRMSCKLRVPQSLQNFWGFTLKDSLGLERFELVAAGTESLYDLCLRCL